MQNGLKYSIQEAQAQATTLRDNATQMESDLNTCKSRITELYSSEEFKTVAASTDFFGKIDEAATNFPKFIEAINKFATFLDTYVANSYAEADTDAQSAQATLESEIENLRNSGNLGA